MKDKLHKLGVEILDKLSDAKLTKFEMIALLENCKCSVFMMSTKEWMKDDVS
jgi:hypothetical protein